jgi:hypothetical protein
MPEPTANGTIIIAALTAAKQLADSLGPTASTYHRMLAKTCRELLPAARQAVTDMEQEIADGADR